jgi:hypothetical protein
MVSALSGAVVLLTNARAARSVVASAHAAPQAAVHFLSYALSSAWEPKTPFSIHVSRGVFHPAHATAFVIGGIDLDQSLTPTTTVKLTARCIRSVQSLGPTCREAVEVDVEADPASWPIVQSMRLPQS